RRVLLRGNGDTVDIGDVRINTTDTIRIVFENKGNISVHARTTSVEDITPLIRQTYSVVRGISARADVTPNGYDTLTIAFSPVSEGESFARIVMQTDIQSRVSGVPEAAANPSIVVRAFGTRAKLQYLQSSVQYDSVPVFQECYSERKRTVTVRNQGNAILRVTSLVIQPLQSPYSVTQAPFDLQPNQTQSFDVIFSPRTVSTFNSQLLVYTSDSDQPYSLPLSGRGVPADVSDISLPDGITYFPGHAVRIPIIAKASALGVTKDFTTTIRFDSSMLKYSTFSTTNTASTSATVNISEQVRGQLTCSISMPANSRFRAVDTLIWLVFDSYLGYAAETETILINPQLGTENCTSALPLRVTNGVVAVDSLCGLVYKIPKRRAKFSSYIVESSDGIDIVSTLPFAMPLHYRVITMTGETVAEESIVTAKEGENRLHITTSRFAAGVYYLVITAEHLKGTVQFAITR
ncbi:MAG: hypothetical protein JNL32_15485, partial [Candidatus Kapabacteria bacterium]|nr:hypothetical protein [Candidatus Kapabacteria bacterium]